jgi:glycosyltransferase involved in cell wall biosynthesis
MPIHADLAVIVAVYKNVGNLDLILKGLARQTFQNFELIIAEDNEGAAMAQFIESAQKDYAFPIKHITQPDKGFLKCRALNKSLAITDAEYIVFIDGDCIPHTHFLEQHYRNRAPKLALYGRRVMLSEGFSKKLLAEKNIESINFLNLLRYRCERLDCAFYIPPMPSSRSDSATGIWGCNWSIHRADLLAINGFDEDYTLPGIGEDVDIEWRLVATGVKLGYIKFKAIQYHLFHEMNYTQTDKNDAIMLQKKAANEIVCKQGINQYL